MEHHPVYSIQPLSAAYPEPENPAAERKVRILIQGTSVLCRTEPQASVLFWGPLPAKIAPGPDLYLGREGNDLYYTAEIPAGTPLPEGFVLSPVRELFGRIPDHELALAAYAVRIADFDRTNRFCGRCGKAMRPLRTERARLCTDCNRIVYPRISPAIIVLIKKGDLVLLASSPRFPAGMHSIIAGFVEPGENLEETVHREVREEVGIEVRNIRYVASEPWPFPGSLMIGFVADHAGGEIAIDHNEIESAGWFSRDNLPVLPSKASISSALIAAWIHREI